MNLCGWQDICLDTSACTRARYPVCWVLNGSKTVTDFDLYCGSHTPNTGPTTVDRVTIVRSNSLICTIILNQIH